MRNESRDRDDSKGRKPFKKRKNRPCIFCEGKTVDYKEQGMVRRFISDRGKILPRRFTGCCAKHQRKVAQIVKRARHAGIIIYTGD